MVPPIADMTLLMLVSAVGVQLVSAVEPLSTETTLRMSFEATLVNSTRIIITEFFMLSKLLYGKQIMLVCKDLFVPRAEITEYFVMHVFNVSMQVRPSPASDITG